MAQPPASIVQRIFAHIMTFGLCVAMPAVIMFIMPVASTTFTRQGDGVSATTVRKIFFVIPVLTESVARVTGVDDEYIGGTLSKTTRSGPVNDPMRPATRSEDMSWLLIQGRGEEAKVPVSPANIDDVRRQVRDFLADDTRPELRLFTVANWKISVVTGAVLSLLTLIYLGCMTWGFASLFFQKRETG